MIHFIWTKQINTPDAGASLIEVKLLYNRAHVLSYSNGSISTHSSFQIEYDRSIWTHTCVLLSWPSRNRSGEKEKTGMKLGRRVRQAVTSGRLHQSTHTLLYYKWANPWRHRDDIMTDHSQLRQRGAHDLYGAVPHSSDVPLCHSTFLTYICRSDRSKAKQRIKAKNQSKEPKQRIKESTSATVSQIKFVTLGSETWN